MKKIYISSVMFVAAVLTGFSSFAQLTVETYDNQSQYGEVVNGEVIHVDGTYTQTAVGTDGKTYNVTSVELAIMQFTSGWAFVKEHRIIVANSTVGKLGSGIINKDIVVPAAWKPSDIPAGSIVLIQTRVFYDQVKVDNKLVVDVYSNAYTKIVEGGVTVPTDVPAGLTVDTYDAWSTYGDVVHGETIHIDGTFSPTFVGTDGVTYPVTSVEVAIMRFTSGWATLMDSRVILHDANNGDLTGLTINYDYKVADSIPYSALQPTDIWLFQTRAFYDKVKVDNKLVVDQYINAWLKVVEGTTAVKQSMLAAEVNVYPNPVSKGNVLRVKANELSGDVNVRMINLLGREVYQKVMQANDISIQTGNLVSGVYFVNISQGGKSFTKKVAVQ